MEITVELEHICHENMPGTIVYDNIYNSIIYNPDHMFLTTSVIEEVHERGIARSGGRYLFREHSVVTSYYEYETVSSIFEIEETRFTRRMKDISRWLSMFVTLEAIRFRIKDKIIWERQSDILHDRLSRIEGLKYWFSTFIINCIDDYSSCLHLSPNDLKTMFIDRRMDINNQNGFTNDFECALNSICSRLNI